MVKASIIMNTFNEKIEYLIPAIESYLSQEGCEIELIISTIEDDVNVELIKEKYPEVKLEIMKRKDHPGKSPLGSFLQLNNALKHITGDWFCFASSNDLAYPFKIRKEIDTCMRFNRQVCYSAYNNINTVGAILDTIRFNDYNYKRHLQGNFVSDCALISTKLLNRYMPFNTDLNNYAYWDLWLRIYKGEGNVFIYNRTPTWQYRQNPDSMHLSRINENKNQKNLIDRETMLSRHINREPRKIKVLNICDNDWANFSYENAKALKSVGVEVVCLKLKPHQFNYPEQGKVSSIHEIIREIRSADYIQYFFSISLYKTIERYLRGKRLIVWYASSDFRANKEEYLRTFNPFVHKSVIALGEFSNLGAKNEHYIVGAVDTDSILPSNKEVSIPYQIAHYPSNPEVKGTSEIITMMDKVSKKDRWSFRSSIERVDFESQTNRLKDCDIYIELFNTTLNGEVYGSFGITALEAAAMGKIVVTMNLSKSVYEKTYGYCPFILVHDAEEFNREMNRLINMRLDQIVELQNITRDWVVKNHSYVSTGKKINEDILC